MLPAGRLSLTATYAGDANHGGSVSPPTAETVAASPASGFGSPATYATGAAPVQIAAADFNQDGNLDLVAANSTAGTVSVLFGKGDGTFGPKTDYTVQTGPAAVLAADFNNDGWPDIAVANANSGTVSILLNKGNGTFQAAQNYPAASGLTYLAASDFNGDGNVDLVVFNNYSTGSQVFLGNGDGTFQPAISTGRESAFGVVGDFNGDGKIDIATSSSALLLGNGDGTFQLTTPNVSWGGPLAAGDMNGDGKLDVVWGDSYYLYVYLGNGDGTFQLAGEYATQQGAAFLLLADVNGDGKLDVITGAGVGNSLNVFFGNGDGSLQPAVAVPASASPDYAVAGDFNGDGITDLAIANGYSSSNLTVLLGVLTPVLTVTSSHTGSFALGQTNATYTIAVKNDGPGATVGALTVTDTLPTGMTATAIAGTGWTCTVATVSCTRSDKLAVGATYPAIAVAVTVGAVNSSVVINQATASGGGAVSAAGLDPTSIQGTEITFQTNPSGLLFSIDGAVAQTAPLTVTLSPGSHTIAAASTQGGSPGTQYVFTGWSDSGNASHSITVGASPSTYTATFQTQYEFVAGLNPYPGGTVTPQSAVFYDAGTALTLTAIPNAPYVFSSWSGGVTSGANPLQVTLNAPLAVTATFVVPGFTCAVTGDGAASVADAQQMINEALGMMPPNDDLTHDRVVNVADVQKVVDAVLQLGCIY